LPSGSAILCAAHILPALGARPLSALRRADVEKWAAGLSVAPSTVATLRQHLGQILTAAVEDGLIPRNPAVGARLPRFAAKPEPVAADVVDAIVARARPRSAWRSPSVLASAYGRVRLLPDSRSCRLPAPHVRVDRQFVTRPGGGAPLEAPKTSSSFRTIPLAGFVVDALAAHIAEHGLGEHDLILHQPDGRPVDSNRFGAVWRSARNAAGAPSVDYHDLRHTFASRLLSQGCR
jgi:integrase